MCIHILNTFLFVSKKGMKDYPMMLYQACVNPYNSDFDSQLSMLMPIGSIDRNQFLSSSIVKIRQRTLNSWFDDTEKNKLREKRALAS